MTSHASSGELVPRGFDYAPAPESRGIVSIRDAYGLFVGGEWREPEAMYTTIAPSSEEPLAEVGQAGQAVQQQPAGHRVDDQHQRDHASGAAACRQQPDAARHTRESHDHCQRNDLDACGRDCVDECDDADRARDGLVRQGGRARTQQLQGAAHPEERGERRDVSAA